MHECRLGSKEKSLMGESEMSETEVLVANFYTVSTSNGKQMKKWMESYGKGPDRTPAESSKSDLERRLDRVLDQLEELRRDLKKK